MDSIPHGHRDGRPIMLLGDGRSVVGCWHTSRTTGSSFWWGGEDDDNGEPVAIRSPSSWAEIDHHGRGNLTASPPPEVGGPTIRSLPAGR